MRSRRKHRRRQRLHLKRPASGQNPQPAQIVWLALRSSSLRLAPARRSSPMAGNRAVAGRVGTIRDRAPVVAALIATGRAGRSGSLWDALGRADRLVVASGAPRAARDALLRIWLRPLPGQDRGEDAIPWSRNLDRHRPNFISRVQSDLA